MGRWHSIDPWAEDFISISPYHYVYNNPVNGIDPNGKGGILTFDEENKTASLSFNLNLYAGEGVTQEDITNAVGNLFKANDDGTFSVSLPTEDNVKVTANNNEKYDLTGATVNIKVISADDAAKGIEKGDATQNYFEVRKGHSENSGRSRTSTDDNGGYNVGFMSIGLFNGENATVTSATNIIGDEMWHSASAYYSGDNGFGGHNIGNESSMCFGAKQYSRGQGRVLQSDVNALYEGTNPGYSPYWRANRNNTRQSILGLPAKKLIDASFD